VPSPAAPPSGCRFHTRCWLYRQLNNPENCVTQEPELRVIGSGHRVACHWAEEVPETFVAQAVPTVEVGAFATPAGVSSVDATVAASSTRSDRLPAGGAASPGA